MDGTILGGLAAAVFFVLFQLCGLVCAFGLLANKPFGLRLLSGSVLGSVLLQWLPALFAFLFGFSILSHVLALAFALLCAALLWVRRGMSPSVFVKGVTRPNALLLTTGVFLYFIFAFLTFHSFRQVDGAVYSSQCTFGDMSMHLGFITSIAEQGIFPPQYSILSGTMLAYPFLSDSISSSLYLLGASLPAAYFLPMLFAGAQVMGGAALLLRIWLKNGAKALCAFLLFFLNGGFGFAYFLSGIWENPENFTRMFTSFYETPTNLIGENIRFVNVIVDMLVPQRATLFGWAVLFAALCLLHQGIHARCRRCFIFTALLAGALPMIHTHSFLVLALISGAWLLAALLDQGCPGFRWGVVRLLLFALPFVMALLQICLGGKKEAGWLLYPPLILLFGIAACMVYLAAAKKAVRPMLLNWGVYLGIVLALALPQLLTWTFRQAQGEQFTRGYFNWDNQNDGYLWFYLKNMGIVAALYLPAVLWAKKQTLKMIAPVFIIFFVSELVVFQPNPYDNNKLIYIAFFFMCGLAADYGATLYGRLRGLKGRRLLASAVMSLGIVSALLTIGREAVAEYQLFHYEYVKTAAFVKTNTKPEDVILTDTRHNNAVAALTGRNIVCGSPSYVYYHGLDYTGRQADVAAMYAYPKESMELYRKYDVSYVLVSDDLDGRLAADEETISALFPLVFKDGGVRLYKVI